MLNLCKALLCPCHVLGSAQVVSELLVCPRLRAHGKLASWQAGKLYKLLAAGSCQTQLEAANILGSWQFT